MNLGVSPRFNPCFNGTYSLTIYDLEDMALPSLSFNPCFNGTYSLTVYVRNIYVLFFAF